MKDMNEELSRAKLKSAENRVNTQLVVAIERARAYLEKRVEYKWGSKTDEALDCSGLMTKCYPILFEGTEKQYEQLRKWLFTGTDLRFIEHGDIVFFAEKNNATRVLHVGIVEQIENRVARIIHSSESRGGVVKDNFDIEKNVFCETYFAVAVAKIRPFLFRRFLNDEIMRSLQDAK